MYVKFKPTFMVDGNRRDVLGSISILDGLFLCGDDLDATKGVGSNFTIPDECHFSPSRTTVQVKFWSILLQFALTRFDTKYL